MQEKLAELRLPLARPIDTERLLLEESVDHLLTEQSKGLSTVVTIERSSVEEKEPSVTF